MSICKCRSNYKPELFDINNKVENSECDLILFREHFGTRHPLYIKALLHFCHFSSEFKQDQSGVDVAKVSVDVAMVEIFHILAISLIAKRKLLDWLNI